MRWHWYRCQNKFAFFSSCYSLVMLWIPMWIILMKIQKDWKPIFAILVNVKVYWWKIYSNQCEIIITLNHLAANVLHVTFKWVAYATLYWDQSVIIAGKFCETQWRHRKPFWMGARGKQSYIRSPPPYFIVLASSVTTMGVKSTEFHSMERDVTCDLPSSGRCDVYPGSRLRSCAPSGSCCRNLSRLPSTRRRRLKQHTNGRNGQAVT